LWPKIYPFLGFESPLEYLPDPLFRIEIDVCTHQIISKYSRGICFPTAHRLRNTSQGSYDASKDQEHLHGLVTILAFIAFRNLKALFHARSARGISLSELYACFKAETLSSSYCFPAVSYKSKTIPVKECFKFDSPRFEALLLKTSSFLTKFIKPH
jgi:hypothetical protein